MSQTYLDLIALLDQHGADYTLIDHPEEGRTELVSAMRGNPVAQAAKCIILMVKTDKKTKRYVLAVVPGDQRVSLDAIKAHYQARYVGFADAEIAAELAKTVPGTVLPFVLHPDLELIVDPEVLEQPRLYFNAARLDRSISMATADYQRIAAPATVPIAQRT